MRLIDPAGAVRVRIAAAGDIGVVGTGRARARREGFATPLAAIAPVFAAADLAFANLEFPVAEPGWVEPGRSAEFWHDADLIPALARAGVRVVSIANNHIMDCGPRGLARTREACAAAGIATVGAGSDLAAARAPAWFAVGGERVMVLAYAAPGAPGDVARGDAPGIAPLEADLVREDLARWGGEATVKIVSVHWGSMYVDYPPPRVLELARVLADAGVDLVLGHHPHVVQAFDRTGRTLTLYSLGDGAFNGGAGDVRASVGAETRLGSAVFTALIAETPGLEMTPCVLDPDGFPRAATPAEAEEIRGRVTGLAASMRDAAERFAAQSAPQLLRYELELIGAHLRHGRFDRIVRIMGSLRPRHLPILWHAVRRARRSS
ncbi:MAG: CapA family protein [Candidatus Eisenbacteria bacterium]|uniref:CapA family protein n=1 Tax=Eiseniibacteriota bacterium TaxID=2212470 RepID=A0A9D6L8X3_UNCEI|nr:CapA family protein [Candidatus Eisenbacteria bacterium]MBI3540034.1 CapA family protein [Candidatus Eisenbacteria bacterium]